VSLKTPLKGLKVDVNVIYTSMDWFSPLHLACTSGNQAVVELLLCLAGSRVNLRDKEGWTALHCATAEGHLDIIKVLGRCQGYPEGVEEREGWVYPPDGPIELNALNEEGKSPIDVSFDETKSAIQAVINGIGI
jgi:ankyrin repeat protein